MSDLLTGPSDEDAVSRRRALWALLVLVLVAVLIGAVMVFVIGSSGGDSNNGLTGGSIAPVPTQPANSSHPSSPHRSTPAPTPTSVPPKPTSTANPCPSSRPCAVPNDIGQAVQALNNFRVHHGRKAVPGSVSAKAQQCALSQGNGSSCVPHYSWQPGSNKQDGAQVIAAIAARSDGTQWLLDPAMSSFSVGWAYTPGSGGAGHYECAILKFG